MQRLAQALYAGEEIEEMHELSEAGLLDEFFVFVREIGMMAVLEQMELLGVQQVLVPTVQLVLLYLLKVLVGGQSMHELPRVLFSQVALMELIGFNARQIEEGLTRRGDAQRTTKRKQGPLSPQSLAAPLRGFPENLAVFLDALWRSRVILLCPLRVEGLDRCYDCLGIRARLYGMIEHVDCLVILGIGQRNRDAPNDRDMHMGRSRSR